MAIILLGISTLVYTVSLSLVTSVNAQQFSHFSDFQNMRLDELDIFPGILDSNGNKLSEAEISANEKRVTGGPFEGTRVRDNRIDIKYTPDANVDGCEKIVFIQVVKRTGTKGGPDDKP